MNAIKDSVHDYVEVDGVAADLLDTPPVQRLRHIKQLSTVRLVYPSANHTRFEHSLGVYHLADRALESLGVTGERAERARAAALLHDVGHGPYGHQTEDIIERRLGRDHDEIHDLLATGPVARVLADHGLNTDAVADLVAGERPLGQLVAGELDVDRMDYLVRDAHHTGVPYGTIDVGRLVRELRLVEGELVLAAGNVQTAESLLVGRALMNATVYRHHVSRIAGAMLQQASERLLAAGTSIDEFRRMADHDLLVRLRTTAETATLGERLERRNLYKRAVWAEYGAVPAEVRAADHEARAELEATVAERAGVDPAEVLLDVPDEPRIKESTVRVVVGDEIRRLDQQSPLVEALLATERSQWRLGVYCPEDHVDQVGRAAAGVLGLEPAGDLVREVRGLGVETTLDRFE